MLHYTLQIKANIVPFYHSFNVIFRSLDVEEVVLDFINNEVTTFTFYGI